MHKEWAQQTMKRITDKLAVTVKEIGPRFPHAAKEREYDERNASWWTNGFWPGILWLAYQYTNDETFSSVACEVEEKLDEVLDGYVDVDHDAGFLWMLSAGANYKITGNQASRIRLLKAASYLSSRFNIKGGFIRAWSGAVGASIIDCTMNLTLLYWASNELGDPRFFHVAQEQLNTVLNCFMRPDGSVNHVLLFDPDNGELLEALRGQALSPDSAWSRGTAWALYGLALAYRHLHSEEYLSGCKRVANFFLANLPENMVAHWDFRAERTPETPRDTSAAACAACGLLELSQHLPGAEGRVYAEKAYLILQSLTDQYSNLDNDSQALLCGGAGHVPANSDVNVGLIFGDYFYVEGISRLLGNQEIFWYSNPDR